jgi:hypothetical protein
LNKAAYVRSQGQDRHHECHWPGCQKQVPPAMWGCRTHWARIPADLQRKIWKAYRPGQEKDMRPSEAYLAAAHEVQEWIKSQLPPPEPVTGDLFAQSAGR